MTCFGSSNTGELLCSSARSSRLAAAMDAEIAVSEARVCKLARGELRTYFKNAADDHRPKICTRHRSTPASAKWHAPDARAEWPVCFGAPFSQKASRPAFCAIDVNVLAHPCLDGFFPSAVGNNHLLAFPGDVAANASCAAIA